MKTFLKSSALVALAMSLTIACSGDDLKAAASEAKAKAEDVVGDLDLSSLSPEAMTEKVSELSGNLTAKLGEVKDKASAEEVSKALGPVVDQIGSMKKLLGDKMPDISALKETASNLASKFGGDSGIMEVLKPLLDKIQALFQ